METSVTSPGRTKDGLANLPRAEADIRPSSGEQDYDSDLSPR